MSHLDHRPDDSCADLARQNAELRAEVAKLRRHYDAAGPEHNLLALLDLYHEREQEALALAASAQAQAEGYLTRGQQAGGQLALGGVR